MGNMSGTGRRVGKPVSYKELVVLLEKEQLAHEQNMKEWLSSKAYYERRISELVEYLEEKLKNDK